ncbi:4a-hydroxytetrahydrobiopterin dehydratase [Acidobacterium sp. S8]|uniref:4a-hydroxytetrahydrobiopterin dehydratase n=1 Tax=Acidobacterium sp. S8 TaxID=1641854 RepID=UPI00131D446B|nr:4a-hydroxytetrahydrobiopterin dehydratase [Acidobacterium sp. S8]
MATLRPEEIQEKLKQLHEWKLVDEEIVREFSFAGFVEALRFVNAVGEKAEAAGHHPDIDIRYNRVKLVLTTHDAGGLTTKDFDLARTTDDIYSKF